MNELYKDDGQILKPKNTPPFSYEPETIRTLSLKFRFAVWDF